MSRFLIVFFLLLTYFSQAQIVSLTPLKKANQSFEGFSYSTALEYYQMALKDSKDSTYVIDQIALCYKFLNQSSQAEIWFEKAISSQEVPNPMFYYHYAEALVINQKDSLAISYYQKYIQSQPKDPLLAAKKIAGLLSRGRYYVDSAKYEINPVTFNSLQSDFSPTYYQEGIAFLSSRNLRKWIKDNYNWDQSSFLDFYKVSSEGEVSDDGFEMINSRYHEGPGQFYDGDTKFVFTRNAFSKTQLKRDNSGVSKLQIFFSQKDSVDQEFTEATPFEHNDFQYSSGHPTISSDGKTLIFISDQQVGFGGTDLYISFLQNGHWTQPVNMGSSVNTSQNEVFPYLVQDDQLIFASNGHPGLGGMDLFRVALDEFKPVGRVTNLGYPINSNQDDFGLISQPDFSSGYLSSNRLDETNDDIFYFEFKKAQKVLLAGQVLAYQDSAKIAGATVSIQSRAGQTWGQVVTDAQGAYEILVPWNEQMQVTAFWKDLEQVDSVLIATTSKSELIEVQPIYMKPVTHLLTILVVDDETGMTITKPVIEINEVVSGNRLNRISGSMSDYDISPDKDYHVLISKKGYYSKLSQIAGDSTLSTRDVTIALKKFNVGDIIQIDHIYFDLNSANLRKESIMDLNKAVEFLKINATIKVELGAHTDSRGSKNYNQNLSQNRAEAVLKYLIDHGIPKSRISAKGYGESKLVNQCVDGINCSEGEHQQNRRTELKILEQ